MPHGIPSQGANSNTCMTGGTEARCDGWSCAQLPVSWDLSGLQSVGFCFWSACKRVCMHTRVFLFVFTHTVLSINSQGAGHWCPLHGDSPVRLHLARTHQQGHKVNKCQPLNLVPPDRCTGPKQEESSSLFTQIQENPNCSFFWCDEVKTRLPARRQCKKRQDLLQLSLKYHLTYAKTHTGKSTVKSPHSSMGQLNMEKIRAQLDLAGGGETIRSWFSVSPTEYMVHSHS